MRKGVFNYILRDLFYKLHAKLLKNVSDLVVLCLSSFMFHILEEWYIT